MSNKVLYFLKRMKDYSENERSNRNWRLNNNAILNIYLVFKILIVSGDEPEWKK